jgi:hypothetical protein
MAVILTAQLKTKAKIGGSFLSVKFNYYFLYAMR